MGIIILPNIPSSQTCVYTHKDLTAMHKYVEVAAEWYRGSGSTLEESFHVSDYQPFLWG